MCSRALVGECEPAQLQEQSLARVPATPAAPSASVSGFSRHKGGRTVVRAGEGPRDDLPQWRDLRAKWDPVVSFRQDTNTR